MSSYYVELARAHAPLLTLIAPLVGAALALLSPAGRLSWLVAVAAALLAAALSFDFALRALLDGVPIVWAGEGMALRGDGFSLFAAPLVAGSAALVAIAGGALLREFHPRAAPWAMALMLAVGAGWCGALYARELVGLLAATETAWLASVGLIALTADNDRGVLNGALRMLAAGVAGAALFILGAAFMFRSIGSFEIAAIATEHIETSRAAAIGATATMARLGAHIIMAPAIGEGVSIAVAVLGGASVVFGSMQAVGARNLRRLAGYAGVAQVGGVLLCVALGSPAGVAAALVQLVAFAAAAMALFGGAAAGGVRGMDMLDGIGRRAPLASAAMMGGAISLMGAPLTLGFLGRWRFIEAGVGAGWWWAAGAVIFTSLAGVFYGGRLIERIYFRRAAGTYAGGTDLWTVTLAPTLIAAIVAIALGLAPAVLLHAADAAAALLMGIGP